MSKNKNQLNSQAKDKVLTHTVSYLHGAENVDNIIQMFKLLPTETILYILEKSGRTLNLGMNNDGSFYVDLAKGNITTSFTDFSKC